MRAVREQAMSIRMACEAFGVSETCYRYKAKRCAENSLIAEWLVKLTHNQRNWGFGLCLLYLRNVKGFAWNHKRVYRIYRELELNLRIRPRKRLFNVIDDFNREGLCIEVDFSLPALRVIRSLDQVIEWRGKPSKIRCDNGPEYISDALRDWAVRRGVVLQFIQPGKPQQNAYIERYNKTVRYDWLAHYLFETVADVQEYATKWLWSYNHERPNTAIGGVPPKQKLPIAA